LIIATPMFESSAKSIAMLSRNTQARSLLAAGQNCKYIRFPARS
jgi:hypothetical protein